MFRLHKSKHSPMKPGENINFKFSHFEALEVPKGWDKLFVSIISVETGKAVAKTSKAAVRNGHCQWTDSVSDSVWIPKENLSHSSMEHEYCPYKFVLSMGPKRSGILGEVVINMAAYMSSSDSFPVSLPLDKSSHGSILQLKIQCLTPRISLRDFCSQSAKEDDNISSNDAEMKSGDDSDDTFVKSARSYSSKDLSSNSHEEDNEKGGAEGAPEEGSFVSSGLHHSYNSAECSIEKEGFSSASSSNGFENKPLAKHDSTGSQNSVPRESSDVENGSESDYSSRNVHSENLSHDNPLEFSAAFLRISGSSKSSLEAAEDTIFELQSEAKNWERKARESMLDLEILSKKYTEQSKIQANLAMELSAASAERDCLQKEAENLKQLLEKASEWPDQTVQDNGHTRVVKEMEDEIRFLKETTDDLTRQLQRSQESNVKLVSVLQELEETETGKVGGNVDMTDDLNLQVQQLQESKNILQTKVRELEKALEDKDQTKETEITTECLNDLQNDKMVLSSTVKTRSSANKVLERKSSELEERNRELGVRLTELEQENEELSGCISILEDQIQNLTDDRKSIALELHNSRSNSITLQDEIARLRSQMQIQETDARGKLEEINNLWSEDRKGLDNLRNENPKLQATAESLIKKCSTLQNSVRQLRMHNLALQEHCDSLEAKLSETQKNFADCSKRVNVLQENLCSLAEESTSKERSLTSELDTLVKENDTQNKKIIVLDQMHTEKSTEAKNLRKELEDLNRQLCSTRDEKDRQASASAKEASDLWANISNLEAELKTTQIESKANIEDLMDELASSKQNQETLRAEMVKMSNSLANYKANEENFKTTLNSLELKLTVSEYERQQLTEETAKLKAQLVKMEPLENEVVRLRNEKQKLETSLDQKSEECRELNTEKSSCIEKITELRENLAELEDCRQEKLALEQRIEKLECNLIANEALCEQDIELRKELSWVKRSNKQLQQQIKQLEEEKQKLKTTNQSLEEELIWIKERQRNIKDSSSLRSPNYQNQREDDKLMDGELLKSKESRTAFKVQLKRLTSEERKSRPGPFKNTKGEVESVAKEKFERTKSSLQTELRELQDRYLDMSLKYAQVEAEREELVMKLRGNNNGKRCF